VALVVETVCSKNSWTLRSRPRGAGNRPTWSPSRCVAS